jgi:hypothetical protein
VGIPKVDATRSCPRVLALLTPVLGSGCLPAPAAVYRVDVRDEELPPTVSRSVGQEPRILLRLISQSEIPLEAGCMHTTATVDLTKY